MRENYHRPVGLGPESGDDGVAALENSTTIPCTLRLVFTAFRIQRNRK